VNIPLTVDDKLFNWRRLSIPTNLPTYFLVKSSQKCRLILTVSVVGSWRIISAFTVFYIKNMCYFTVENQQF